MVSGSSIFMAHICVFSVKKYLKSIDICKNIKYNPF